MAKILIAGGSGLIGTNLQKFLKPKGHEVYILSRNPGKDSPYEVFWDPYKGEIDSSFPQDIEYVINLTGAAVLP